MLRSGFYLSLIAIVVALLPALAHGAPNVPVLDADETRKAVALARQVQDAWQKADITRAVELTKSLFELRREKQGANHWESIEARCSLDMFQRVAGLPKNDQLIFSRIPGLFGEADQKSMVDNGEQSRIIYQQIVDDSRRLLGGDSQILADAYNNLALVLEDQHKYEAAQQHRELALNVRKRLLTEHHPDVAQSYNNMALSLDSHGRHSDAEPLYKKALEVFLAVYGEHHDDTAIALANRGRNFEELGRFEEAEEHHNKSLRI